MIAREAPDVAHLREMSLDFERPAFKGGFAFPKQPVVAMDEEAILVVFGGVVAK